MFYCGKCKEITIQGWSCHHQNVIHIGTYRTPSVLDKYVEIKPSYLPTDGKGWKVVNLKTKTPKELIEIHEQLETMKV